MTTAPTDDDDTPHRTWRYDPGPGQSDICDAERFELVGRLIWHGVCPQRFHPIPAPSCSHEHRGIVLGGRLLHRAAIGSGYLLHPIDECEDPLHAGVPFPTLDAAIRVAIGQQCTEPWASWSAWARNADVTQTTTAGLPTDLEHSNSQGG